MWDLHVSVYIKLFDSSGYSFMVHFSSPYVTQGGSEMWSVTASEVTTVIASLAFHPSERLLVIATNSTLYFWDWNIPQPFAKCSTANEKQKLR